MGAEASLWTRGTPSRAESSCGQALCYISESSLLPRPAGQTAFGVAGEGRRRGSRPTAESGYPASVSQRRTRRPHGLLRTWRPPSRGGQRCRWRPLPPSPSRIGVRDEVILEGQVVEVSVHVAHHAVLPEELCLADLAPLLSAATRHAGEPLIPACGEQGLQPGVRGVEEEVWPGVWAGAASRSCRGPSRTAAWTGASTGEVVPARRGPTTSARRLQSSRSWGCGTPEAAGEPSMATRRPPPSRDPGRLG